MAETQDLKEILVKTLGGIDLLIQREMHSDRIVKAATDAALKMEALEGQVKEAQQKLNALQIEKDALLATARKQADEILKEAETKRQEASQALTDARKANQQAQDALVDVEKTRSIHESALREVTAQREKLKAALVG